jgi:hypothetical protein
MKVWYEGSARDWSIDFSTKGKYFAKESPSGKQIFLRPSQRATNLYYKDKDNTWVPLSLYSNYKIDQHRAAAKSQRSANTSITIRENMKNTGVIDKLFGKSRVRVDWQKKKLTWQQTTFDLKYEKELDWSWRYEYPRAVNVPNVQLGQTDPEFIKVKDAFNLTMPLNKVKTVIRYYLQNNEYLTFLKIIKDTQSQVGYDVTEKLLWSWEFTCSPDKYNVKENLDPRNYGKGYQFASSANIAVKLRKDPTKKLVLGMVLVGNSYYTRNKIEWKGYEAVAEHFKSLACYYDSGDVTGWIYVVPDHQRILPMYVIDWE